MKKDGAKFDTKGELECQKNKWIRIKKKKTPPPDRGRSKKSKKPRTRPKDPPADDYKIVRRPPPPPRGAGYPPVTHPVYVEITHYYSDYADTEPNVIDGETASIIFTTTSLLFNAAYISIGQPNTLAAAAGFVFGATSMVVASRDNSRHRGLHYLLGAASIALSVWNLSGGVQPTGPPDDRVVYGDYSASAYNSAPPSLGFSYTF